MQRPTTRQFIHRWLVISQMGWGCLSAGVSWAEPVWHCSKTRAESTQSDQQNFLNKPGQRGGEIIRLSIRDLYDAYQDIPVQLGKQVLSACFLSEDSSLSKEALSAIGTDVAEIKALSQSASHLIQVKDETEMIACISQHHPAIGYISGHVNTTQLGPCF